MRPTDEDQPGSRRPNLMASSRRGASDVNILAMLDGLGSRPHAKRTLLWYGAGGLLACGLIATLVWLAHEPATPLDAPTVAGALPPAPVASSAASPLPIERRDEAQPAPAEPQPAAGAAIVDLASAPPPAPAAPEPDAPAAPSFAAVESPAPAEPPNALTAPRSAPAPHASTAKSPAVHLAPARLAAASGHAMHAGPKRGSAALKPAPAPTAMDTDVALISAIIQHAANQRDAAEDNGCGDPPCGPRTPPRP